MDISVGHFYKPTSPARQISAAVLAGALALLTVMRLGVIATATITLVVFGAMAAVGRGLSHLSYTRQRRVLPVYDGEFIAEAVESGRAGLLKLSPGHVGFQPRKEGQAIDLPTVEISHVYLTPINRLVVATHVSLVIAEDRRVEMNVTAPGRDVEAAFRRCAQPS